MTVSPQEDEQELGEVEHTDKKSNSEVDWNFMEREHVILACLIRSNWMHI